MHIFYKGIPWSHENNDAIFRHHTNRCLCCRTKEEITNEHVYYYPIHVKPINMHIHAHTHKL